MSVSYKQVMENADRPENEPYRAAKSSGGRAEHHDKDTTGSACESRDTGSDMPCTWM